MTRASLAAFRRTVTVEWPRTTEANAKKLLIRVAQQGHAKIMADDIVRSGSRPEFQAYANRPGNENLQSVVLPGPIVYRYFRAGEILRYALEELRKASPVLKGDYKASHTVYIDGQAVKGIPKLIPGKEVFISNPVPYARRLEIGKTTSGRSFVIQVPDRIYERVAIMLRKRYRRIANVTFNYVQLPGAYSAKGRLPSHYGIGNGKRRKRDQKPGPIRAPAIFIEPLV